jgi:hypothetical protein
MEERADARVYDWFIGEQDPQSILKWIVLRVEDNEPEIHRMAICARVGNENRLFECYGHGNNTVIEMLVEDVSAVCKGEHVSLTNTSVVYVYVCVRTTSVWITCTWM